MQRGITSRTRRVPMNAGKRIQILLLGSALAAFPFCAAPQTTTSGPATATVPTEKLVTQYTTLAGSETNAKSLINGLRTGGVVTLTSTSSSSTTRPGPFGTGTTSSTVTFDPPTGTMGYGSIDNALKLAEASLKQAGITNPTPEQLKAALMGGTIKTSSGEVKLAGILQMRADGMGWGKIANTLGFKLGELKRSDKAAAAPGATKSEAAGSQRASREDRPGGGKSAERPDRPEKVERPQRPERAERPQRPERPGK
ncbi:MAG: hypothetical protein ACREUO_11775 [Burkholderiales bacterium]